MSLAFASITPSAPGTPAAAGTAHYPATSATTIHRSLQPTATSTIPSSSAGGLAAAAVGAVAATAQAQKRGQRSKKTQTQKRDVKVVRYEVSNERTCICGNHLFPDSIYCRRCGRKWPEPNNKAYQQSFCEHILELEELNKPASAKALQVNLTPDFYGSFAEIGAGQEVSRIFLTAGAAAGTVARSVSAYDMRVSDSIYGKSSRYVTQERLGQMLEKEYELLERDENGHIGEVRKDRGPDCRFFSFATTLAAKAYNSDRECEGWVGLRFQHEAGAQPSNVHLHVRMTDDTAQKQGEAIGILGTNLIYLCNRQRDPNTIVPFLLDTLKAGRLEVDFVDFSGPAFPRGCWEPALMALRMVQFQLAKGVLLEKKDGKYQQTVPNSSLYKRPVIVQRSRFQPVTKSHMELQEATARQLQKEAGDNQRPPLKLMNLQIDDLARPIEGLHDTSKKLKRIKQLLECDRNKDGALTKDELLTFYDVHHGGAGSAEERQDVEKLWDLLDVKNEDSVLINDIVGMSSTSVIDSEYLSRAAMIEALGYPVLVSGISQTWQLASYLKRYTNQEVAIVVGGPGYDMSKGLFNEKAYEDVDGGIMEALGVLFAKDVKIYQYPNIDDDGTVRNLVPPQEPYHHLWSYMVQKGWLREVTEDCMAEDVRDPAKNEAWRARTDKIIQLMRESDKDWEHYVPDEVLQEVKSNRQDWYTTLGEKKDAKNFLARVYKILERANN
eukprot:TRINITY_DN100986_c0_g1_i1.p1 TRINITY_DN100986_c0_g1~~TRINITY_DN100986_c0_g1_i1.p1  ORF type:complete len:723 (+),score=189.44 TRINITY_DN100986_c0_g1_i1:88-2256(+)